MAFSKHVTTNAGRDLLLSCMATGDFQIHSLVLGSGEYDGILTEIRDVVEPELSFSGGDLIIEKRGDQLELRCRLTNEQLERGFNWREYGVYATNGTETVLFCYDNAGNEPIPITAASAGAGISNTLKILLSVAEAATVNVNFEPAPDFMVDDTVTESGTNAVTGSAVWKFAGGGIPTPTPEDAGLVIKVQEDGSYGLGEAGLSKVSADIVTAGTLGGEVKANAEAVTDLTVAQVRNIVCGTADVVDVLDSLNVGDLYFTVEEEAT